MSEEKITAAASIFDMKPEEQIKLLWFVVKILGLPIFVGFMCGLTMLTTSNWKNTDGAFQQAMYNLGYALGLYLLYIVSWH